MELAQYVRLFRKWAWLILVGAFVAGGVAFIDAVRRPPVYEASTTIAIGRFIEQPNPSSAEIRTGIDLATTYAQLVRTYTVLQATVDELALPMSADQLSGRVSTRIITGTSLLVISVTYTDPTLTADIANTLAEQIILKSPTNLTSEQQAQIDFANRQIADLNAQLQDARERVTLIDQQLATTDNSVRVAALTSQRDALISQINDASATIAEFSGNVTTLQQRTNALDIVEPARIPTEPTGTSPVRAALLGTAVGAALIIGLVLLYEYMDDKIRTSTQAVEILKLPVLGAIQKFGHRNFPYSDMLLSPNVWSPMAEGFRVLRTNLLYASSNGDQAKQVFAVTSAGPEEGKTVTAANLAVAIAQSGLQVLLIDADLRRPRVHEIFALPNDFGLTNLLFADPDGRDITQASDVDSSKIASGLKLCIQNTKIPRLRVITSGFIPSNPTEILGSALMQRWITEFLASSNVDVVIFDTPPSLVAADTAVLASNIDARIVLVIDAGSTRRLAVLKAKEQFEQLNVRVNGIVLNRVNMREESYGYGYGYGYGYYYTPRAKANGKMPAEGVAPEK